ncbi:protein of unknown function [Oenococcus oeni]|nr:hypothetical protein OENI_20118 [Oenococcus oeni]SYW03924.1 hypothetical protein OENI_90056 [Oenococcus oeni]SYW17689.1 hypothetical protein OENI_10357 [Oenococcus oeni]VDC14586.1 protein of unknown function [Oenococcus oeni]
MTDQVHIEIKNLDELKNLVSNLKTVINQIQNWKPDIQTSIRG